MKKIDFDILTIIVPEILFNTNYLNAMNKVFFLNKRCWIFVSFLCYLKPLISMTYYQFITQTFALNNLNHNCLSTLPLHFTYSPKYDLAFNTQHLIQFFLSNFFIIFSQKFNQHVIHIYTSIYCCYIVKSVHRAYIFAKQVGN